ncbi:energy transducer TonB [Silvibacterium sp.]|uniref:energy transducer TonB n=1 Tax=Silvibacterium sp. TaxID=1964179 RepID=UPI0039E2A6B2
MHARSLSALLGFALLTAYAAPAQTPAATSSTQDISIPKDPKELLSLAREVNGLSSSDMKPWHIKYSYQTFDSDGKQVNQGTFEEWWVAPDKYKREWVSTHLNQTEYHTRDGYFRVGDEGSPSVAELTVLNKVVTQIPPEAKLADYTIQHRDNPYPHANLTCVETAGHLDHIIPGAPEGIFPFYCFDQDKPILRSAGSYGSHTALYQRIGSLGGHYIPIDLQIMDAGKNYATAHLEEGNLIPTVNETAFQPPADAVPESKIKMIAASAAVLKGSRVGGAQPIYPVGSKQDRIQGKVILPALIEEDGSVQQLEVLTAPDYRLAIAAIIAVHSWKYQPYLLNGKPVSVETQINVIYTLGG